MQLAESRQSTQFDMALLHRLHCPFAVKKYKSAHFEQTTVELRESQVLQKLTEEEHDWHERPLLTKKPGEQSSLQEEAESRREYPLLHVPQVVEELQEAQFRMPQLNRHCVVSAETT